MSSEDVDIIIGAKNEASRVIDEVNGSLNRVTTTSMGMSTQFISMAGAIAAVGYAANKIGEGMEQVDQLADKAQMLGSSYDNVNLFSQALSEAAGVDYESAIGSLEKFHTTIGLAEMGMGKALPVLQQLGIDMDSLEGKDVTEQFKMVAEEIGKLESPAQRAAVAMKIFGDPQIAAAIGKNGEAISAIQQQIDTDSKRISDSATQSVARVNDFFGRVSNNFSDGWRRLGAEVSVAATSMYDSISGLFGYDPPETLIEDSQAIADGIAKANEEIAAQTKLAAEAEARQAAIVADQAAKVVQGSNMWKSLTDAAYLREVAITKGEEAARRMELQLNNLSAEQIEEVIAQENDLAKLQQQEKGDKDYDSVLTALQRQLDLATLGTEEVAKQEQLAKARNQEERDRIKVLQDQLSEQTKLNEEKKKLEVESAKIEQEIQKEQDRIAAAEAAREERLKAPTGPVQAFESRLLTRGTSSADPQKKVADNTAKLVELQSQQLKLQEQMSRNKQQEINFVRVG